LPSHEALPQAVPSPEGEQVPCLPVTAQELQTGQVATPQQNPSVQNPLMHWAGEVQGAPFGCTFVQEYPRQLKPVAQSLMLAQEVRQALLPQM